MKPYDSYKKRLESRYATVIDTYGNVIILDGWLLSTTHPLPKYVPH